MSRQVIKTFLSLGAAVLFISAIALAEKPKMINIYTDTVLPSGQVLKAGRYQVGVNETSKQVTFTKGDKIVATSGFQAVEKPEKNLRNEARFGQKDNKQELQELRFNGENRSIMLVKGGSPTAPGEGK